MQHVVLFSICVDKACSLEIMSKALMSRRHFSWFAFYASSSYSNCICEPIAVFVAQTDRWCQNEVYTVCFLCRSQPLNNGECEKGSEDAGGMEWTQLCFCTSNCDITSLLPERHEDSHMRHGSVLESQMLFSYFWIK